VQRSGNERVKEEYETSRGFFFWFFKSRLNVQNSIFLYNNNNNKAPLQKLLTAHVGQFAVSGFQSDFNDFMVVRLAIISG
jgi:hypothetical protein